MQCGRCPSTAAALRTLLRLHTARRFRTIMDTDDWLDRVGMALGVLYMGES
jgi:hypothetical protein